MSNTIINSNSNSALVSTLMESNEAIVNPFTYAEKNIVPPHSVQIVSVPPLNTGNLVANGTIDFDIPKQGVLRRAVLDCIFKKSADSETQCPTGFLFAFESIELLSSGRRISLLTTEGIMAKMSDMPLGVRTAYRNALNMGTTVLTNGGVQDYSVISSVNTGNCLTNIPIRLLTLIMEMVCLLNLSHNLNMKPLKTLL